MQQQAAQAPAGIVGATCGTVSPDYRRDCINTWIQQHLSLPGAVGGCGGVSPANRAACAAENGLLLLCQHTVQASLHSGSTEPRTTARQCTQTNQHTCQHSRPHPLQPQRDPAAAERLLSCCHTKPSCQAARRPSAGSGPACPNSATRAAASTTCVEAAAAAATAARAASQRRLVGAAGHTQACAVCSSRLAPPQTARLAHTAGGAALNGSPVSSLSLSTTLLHSASRLELLLLLLAGCWCLLDLLPVPGCPLLQPL